MPKGTPGRRFLSQDDNMGCRMKLGLALTSLQSAKSHWESFGEVMKGIDTPERTVRLLPLDALAYVEASPDSRRYDAVVRNITNDGRPGRVYHSARKLAFSRT